MITSRRELIAGAIAAGVAANQAEGQSKSTEKFVRFQKGNNISYGIVTGENVEAIQGDLFGSHKKTGAKHGLSEVKLLAPCTPSKVLAVGLNYKSHIGARKPPSAPEIFYKPITCLQNPGDPIVIPKDSQNLHYEGELVIVMGKKASRIAASEAKATIFGVCCGNDVSERDWQSGPNKDLQWWRAKGADTFGPLGPMIVRGIDYGNVMLQTRLNGTVVQKSSTSDLLFDCHAIVSYISQYVTLVPGDVIYTGTPGSTKKMNPADIVEVEIDGVGILRNPIAAA
jgi:2-keto-4-pentenoate hydratase/2-oxohepta-3-ene-1,7-dioic acid hydratase in catechol pathway